MKKCNELMFEYVKFIYLSNLRNFVTPETILFYPYLIKLNHCELWPHFFSYQS